MRRLLQQRARQTYVRPDVLGFVHVFVRAHDLAGVRFMSLCDRSRRRELNVVKMSKRAPWCVGCGAHAEGRRAFERACKP